MMETAVVFRAGSVILEGLLHRGGSSRGAIITHPHSLYGGDMHNPVVEVIGRIYRERGYSTLRFNFRGVGGSTGAFADGQGEREDVTAAIRYLLDSGMDSIELAGYSFGARVLAGMTSVPQQVVSQIHVAPPVAFMDYGSIAAVPKLKTVIAGELDDIGPPELIRQLISTWNPDARLIVIEGGDHFFGTTMTELQKALTGVSHEN